MDFRLSIGSNLPREELGKLLYAMLCEVFFVELIDYEAEVWASSYTEHYKCRLHLFFNEY